jgi:hypothetical protein
MRPTTTDGLTTGQIRFKQRLEAQIQRVDYGDGIRDVGLIIKWVGKSKPKFHFMSFAPITVGPDNRVYDGMTLSRKAAFKLEKKGRRFVKEVGRAIGCIMPMPEQE